MKAILPRQLLHTLYHPPLEQKKKMKKDVILVLEVELEPDVLMVVEAVVELAPAAVSTIHTSLVSCIMQ